MTTTTKTVQLDEGQIESIKHLITKEMTTNEQNGDHAYNTYWMHVLENL